MTMGENSLTQLPLFYFLRKLQLVYSNTTNNTNITVYSATIPRRSLRRLQNDLNNVALNPAVLMLMHFILDKLRGATARYASLCGRFVGTNQAHSELARTALHSPLQMTLHWPTLKTLFLLVIGTYFTGMVRLYDMWGKRNFSIY